jgi:hypothetical protein
VDAENAKKANRGWTQIDADLGLGFGRDAGAIETLSLVTACFILLVVYAIRE